MNSTEIGRKAEAAARVYLEMRGFKIIEQNWRRPRAEIDIIAQKDGVVHYNAHQA
jgi:Holliday junction resolvase-like predicted endonuclease